jgi:hypothetical protein
MTIAIPIMSRKTVTRINGTAAGRFSFIITSIESTVRSGIQKNRITFFGTVAARLPKDYVAVSVSNSVILKNYWRRAVVLDSAVRDGPPYLNSFDHTSIADPGGSS